MHIQSSHFQWVVFFHPKGVAKNGTPTHIHLAPRKEGPGWYIFVRHIRSMQCQCCIEATFLLASKHHFKRCQLFWGVNIRLEVFWIYCTYNISPLIYFLYIDIICLDSLPNFFVTTPIDQMISNDFPIRIRFESTFYSRRKSHRIKPSRILKKVDQTGRRHEGSGSTRKQKWETKWKQNVIVAKKIRLHLG